jgi:hypothetical protein
MSDEEPRRTIAERARRVVRDTASLRLRDVVFGGGAFDTRADHPNRKGWDIYELGQRSFWAVPTAIDWEAEVREDPRYADAIAAMLAFLCPGEKVAVTGATLISTLVKSEEAQFYFAEQALEESKHYDALRRLIPKIAGRPMQEPKPLVRLLYTFGVIEREDVAFMMGNINIVGEHLANQIFHKINHVAVDPNVRKILALIGRDESRHIGAGQRFFPEVYPAFKRARKRIMAKNLTTALILALAAHDLVRPLATLDIDIAEVMENMYAHYAAVTEGLPAFPDQAILDVMLGLVRKGTPVAVRTIFAMTNDRGEIDAERVIAACERALTSPRSLRDLFAA